MQFLSPSFRNFREMIHLNEQGDVYMLLPKPVHLLLIAVFVFAACGKSKGKSDQDPEGNETATETDGSGNPQGSEGKTCRLALDCKAPLPDLGPLRPFQSTTSSILTATGAPLHRGRDMFVKEGDKAWVLAKFTYGILDADLKGEEIDIYLSRGCKENWEKLATVTTSTDGQNAPVDGIEDSGGRIYYEIPDTLKAGRYFSSTSSPPRQRLWLLMSMEP
jgi:hypothetical protein